MPPSALVRKRRLAAAWCGALVCTACFLFLAMNSPAVTMIERGGWIPVSLEKMQDLHYIKQGWGVTELKYLKLQKLQKLQQLH